MVASSASVLVAASASVLVAASTASVVPSAPALSSVREVAGIGNAEGFCVLLPGIFALASAFSANFGLRGVGNLVEEVRLLVVLALLLLVLLLRRAFVLLFLLLVLLVLLLLWALQLVLLEVKVVLQLLLQHCVRVLLQLAHRMLLAPSPSAAPLPLLVLLSIAAVPVPTLVLIVLSLKSFLVFFSALVGFVFAFRVRLLFLRGLLCLGLRQFVAGGENGRV